MYTPWLHAAQDHGYTGLYFEQVITYESVGQYSATNMHMAALMRPLPKSSFQVINTSLHVRIG